jgi:enterobactin synthetase component D
VAGIPGLERSESGGSGSLPWQGAYPEPHPIPQSPFDNLLDPDLRWQDCNLADPGSIEHANLWAERFAGTVDISPAHREHFLVGRYCAAMALARLGTALPGGLIRRSPGGQPGWPAGCTGSITHTDGYVAAVAGYTRDFAGIGIDSERLRDGSTADEIAPLVLDPEEAKLGEKAGLSRVERTFLAFSAKESLYKCLHPAVGRFFGFEAARLLEVNLAAGTTLFELREDLTSRLPAGLRIEGRFRFDQDRVHTAVLLRQSAPYLTAP